MLQALLVRINTAIERTSTDEDSAGLCRVKVKIEIISELDNMGCC